MKKQEKWLWNPDLQEPQKAATNLKIHKSKDVPWKIKRQSVVDHVYAVFTFGSDKWWWTQQTMEKIKGRETKTMTRLFRLKRQKDETWVEYRTRACNMARKIWVQMGLPFLCKKCSESMWRAIVWVCDEKVNTVSYSLKKVCKWRSTRWWHSLHTRLMKEDPENRIRWKHKLRWHNRGNVWDKMEEECTRGEVQVRHLHSEAIHRTQKNKE